MRIKSTIPPDPTTVSTGGQAELGRIGIGRIDKTDPANTYPVATDYFIPRGLFAEQFTALVGENPSQLSIMFNTDNDDFACNERLEIRNKAGKLYAFGDGETFSFYNEKDQKYSLQETIGKRPTLLEDTVSYLQKGTTVAQAKTIKWKNTLYLRFTLIDFPLLGFWQFSTRGVGSSIPALREAFDSCKQTFGTARYIPFLLTVKKVNSNKPNVNRQFAVVSLVPAISLSQGFQLREAMRQNPTANPYSLLYHENPDQNYRPILALGSGNVSNSDFT